MPKKYLPSDPSQRGELIIYSSRDGKVLLEAELQDETIWLSQKQMADLFEKDVRTISEHIQNLFKDQELEKNETIRNFRIVQTEGNKNVTRTIEFYNLDVIISATAQFHLPRSAQGVTKCTGRSGFAYC